MSEEWRPGWEKNTWQCGQIIAEAPRAASDISGLAQGHLGLNWVQKLDAETQATQITGWNVLSKP